MVEKRLRDGKRIAQLLASELTAAERLSIVDVDTAVEPTLDGAFAYAVTRRGGGGDAGGDDPDRIAEVYVHPERARVELRAAPAATAAAAEAAGLRVRPKATRPPRTLIFVEDGAQSKRALSVVREIPADGGGADGDGDGDGD